MPRQLTIPVEPPPTPDTGGPPTPTTVAGKAEYLASIAGPISLYGSLSTLCSPINDLRVYRKLIDNFLADLGDLGPVERMLAEQLFLAHLLGGQLHARGATADNPDAAKVYLNAAARLMGEFRLSALALKVLRTPATPEKPPVEPDAAPAPARSELGSKQSRSARRSRARAA